LPKGEPGSGSTIGGKRVVGERPLPGGGRVRITEDGKIRLCASPCSEIELAPTFQRWQRPGNALRTLSDDAQAAASKGDFAAAESNAAELVGILRRIEQTEQWIVGGKLRGLVNDFLKRLTSGDRATRLGAEGEFRAFAREIESGKTVEITGKGPDLPTGEVKTRTKSFASLDNAQNFFNARIKRGNAQWVKAKKKGPVVVDLGEHVDIAGAPITREVARDLVKSALSKGGRGTNVTNVTVRGPQGVVYEGLGG
jgi:hypothetical protein